MEYYESSASIAAPPDVVWGILTAGRYEQWDSGVRRLEGEVADGNKIKVYSEVDPDRAFPVKVSLDQGRRTMTWTGGMPIPGLFKGERTYRVAPDGDGSAFHMREEYTGLLLGPIFRSMPDLQPSFDQFASGLKNRAEDHAT